MKNDSYFMELAIKEAQKSLDEGGLPIGAVLVKDGEVISYLDDVIFLNGNIDINEYYKEYSNNIYSEFIEILEEYVK